MGQLSDPYNQGEDDGVDLTISGLPEDDFDDPPDDDPPAGAASDDDAVVEDDAVAADESDESDDEESDDDDEFDEELDEEEVAYDLGEWDDAQLDALFDSLDEADIGYLWDGEELFVQASDEQAVDEVLEKVANPDALAADDEDGDGGGWLLGELFVAADRLQHDPEEHETVASLLQLANATDEAQTPYGLGDDVWEQLRERVTALATVLEADKPDADAVIEAARELRNATRPYV